jgi:DNA mismatch repair protein MutS2
MTQRRAQVNDEIKETVTTLDRLESKLTPVRPPAPKTSPQAKKQGLKVGDKVEVPHMNSKGVVTSINKNEIEVQLGHFRTTLKRREIIPTEVEEAEVVTTQRSSGSSGLVESPGLELDLRGRVSEDALLELDGYLDQAYLAGLPFVRIIHGKGSGVLRQVVREALNTHPLISSYKAGGEREGGDGVTVAKLALD